MKQDIRELCKTLRLAYVADVYEKISFENQEQFLYEVLEKELKLRENAKTNRLMKKARFLDKKSLHTYEWTEQIRFPPHLNKEELCSLKFIENRQNVVLVGSPGTGKTHLATGLGRKACEQGYEVRFYRIAHLVEELEQALHNHRLSAFRKRMEKVDLVILDELCKASHNSSYGK